MPTDIAAEATVPNETSVVAGLALCQYPATIAGASVLEDMATGRVTFGDVEKPTYTTCDHRQHAEGEQA